MQSKKINIVTLGCSKNIVDSEYMMGQLRACGYDVVYDSDDTSAKIVVINTCGFIGDAKEESVNTILSFAKAKTDGLIDHLFVMGCLSERYKKDLEAELPEVDSFFGVKDLKDIVARVGGTWDDTLVGERMLTTPSHYAYLKISEGCNWGCSYCAIPLIRGRHISVPIEDLVAEAKLLAARGVRELNVIAQDTTYYGMDLYGERRLAELLERLCGIEGIEWVRLHYAYPAQFPRDVIRVMKEQPKMCKYIDIPFQHISDSVLKSMRRGLTRQETYDLIAYFRAEIPEITIRTTLLTGYPNESADDFEELCRFVTDIRFDRLGVFAYSEEEDTFSAGNYVDNIDQTTKYLRVEKLMTLQMEISGELNKAKVGKVFDVVIDRREDEFLVGRTEFDSPEVDCEVLIESDADFEAGKVVKVEIISAEEYDLYGKLVEIC